MKMLENILKTYDPALCTIPGLNGFEWRKLNNTLLIDHPTCKRATTRIKLTIQLTHKPNNAERESIKDMVIASIENYGAPRTYSNASNIALHYEHTHTWYDNELDIYYEITWEQ